MKTLIMLTLLWLSVLTGCSGASQGRSNIPAVVTLGFATNSSGQLEIFNSTKNTSYGVVTNGTLQVSVIPGTMLRAVWTPAASDLNTAAYWTNSGTPSVNQASGASTYTFMANSSVKVQMHLLAPTNVVQMVAPTSGTTSWTINGVAGQVAAGAATVTTSVRASDDFQVTWNANGSASYISVWDVAGLTTTDRSKKDLTTASLMITSDSTITTELTTQAMPHYRLQIPKPTDGEIDFTNAQSGVAIAFKSTDTRYGSVYEVLTDNTVNTTATLAMTYQDDGVGHGLGSYDLLGQTNFITTTQGATPNTDNTLTFTNTWNCSLANSSADVPMSFGYDDPGVSCTKIGQLFSGGKCYDGTSFCAAQGQQYNGTACY